MGLYISGIWVGTLVVCVGIGGILLRMPGFDFWILSSLFPIWAGSALLVQSVVFAFRFH